MTPEQKKVMEFHNMVDLPVRTAPNNIPPEESKLRHNLIKEELREYKEAVQQGSVVKIADALGDLLYVVLGAGLAHGIDLQPVFDEIHRSNMTKRDGHKNKAGKWIKPKNYTPPDLVTVLNKQKST